MTNRIVTTIVSGAALTDAIDLPSLKNAGSSMTGDGVHLSLIQMPADWTTANLTFEVSVDGSTYAPLYKDDGSEYVVSASTSRVILLNVVDFATIRFIKIRSGTVGTPVNQADTRTLNISFRPV